MSEPSIVKPISDVKHAGGRLASLQWKNDPNKILDGEIIYPVYISDNNSSIYEIETPTKLTKKIVLSDWLNEIYYWEFKKPNQWWFCEFKWAKGVYVGFLISGKQIGQLQTR